MAKCASDCQCGRYRSYERTPEMRARASAQICVDHLDDDCFSNDPENLVPSCSVCNMRRSRQKSTEVRTQR